MDAVNLSLLAILASIFIYLIYQAWKINQFWKEKNVPYIKPLLFIGNSFPQLTGKMSPALLHQFLAAQLPDEPMFGSYDFMKPVLIIRDIDIAEKVMIKDFNHFVDHGFSLDENRNPLDSNLFAMSGKRWKAVRSKLSPIFTSGKLKSMYQCMADCGDLLIKQMDKEDARNDVDMRDIIGRFAMDTIGSTIFGIDAGNLVKPDNEFRRMGKKAVKLDLFTVIKFLIFLHFPTLAKLFNITFSKPEVVKYFAVIIKDTLKHRRENGFKRNDFIQLLMQLQDKGYVEMQTKDAQDDYLNIEPAYTLEKFEMTDEQLTGHAVTFLTAGFETTVVGMMFTLYELSKNFEIQEKVRAEILKKVEYAGFLSHDSLKNMTYLEQCVKESLRKYALAQLLLRICTKEYTFPNGLTIQPGQTVQIAMSVIHHDPKYYPEPEIFKPERFDPDQTLPSCAYIPFGNGPRMCIAMRFAFMEMKYCLAKLLMNYRFTVSPKTKEPIELNGREFLTAPKHTLYFNLEKVTNEL